MVADTERFFQPIVTDIIPTEDESSPDKIPTHGTNIKSSMLGLISSAPAILETIKINIITVEQLNNTVIIVNPQIIEYLAFNIFFRSIG